MGTGGKGAGPLQWHPPHPVHVHSPKHTVMDSWGKKLLVRFRPHGPTNLSSKLKAYGCGFVGAAADESEPLVWPTLFEPRSLVLELLTCLPHHLEA